MIISSSWLDLGSATFQGSQPFGMHFLQNYIYIFFFLPVVIGSSIRDTGFSRHPICDIAQGTGKEWRDRGQSFLQQSKDQTCHFVASLVKWKSWICDFCGFLGLLWTLPSVKLTVRTWKWMVGIWNTIVSFWDGPFSGLVSVNANNVGWGWTESMPFQDLPIIPLGR